MTPLLWIVVKMAVVAFVALLLASLLRARGWTPAGMALAMGNRENMPAPSALDGRADRTARNTLEGFVLFTAIALVAHAAGKVTPQVLLGAEIFFWARLAYIPIYVAGLAYVRTLVWGVSVVGLAMMVYGLG